MENLKNLSLTDKQGVVIRDFLNHYYLEHINSKDKLSLKNQLELLNNYTYRITK